MDDSMMELGRRAVACKGWRWMPGMLAANGGSRFRCLGERYGNPLHRSDRGELLTCGGCIPDLSDPATLGCLLALVREAWGDRGMHTHTTAYRREVTWTVERTSGGLHGLRPRRSEAEALVAALEAAP